VSASPPLLLLLFLLCRLRCFSCVLNLCVLARQGYRCCGEAAGGSDRSSSSSSTGRELLLLRGLEGGRRLAFAGAVC
jgi:hypothetical protein